MVSESGKAKPFEALTELDAESIELELRKYLKI
jgi:hypothetical protein